jgi:hypothetical protein
MTKATERVRAKLVSAGVAGYAAEADVPGAETVAVGDACNAPLATTSRQ